MGVFGLIVCSISTRVFVINYYHQKPKKAQYTFIDIGANDGISFSNTYLLETFPKTHGAYQNWQGILIEESFFLIVKVRKIQNILSPCVIETRK